MARLIHAILILLVILSSICFAGSLEREAMQNLAVNLASKVQKRNVTINYNQCRYYDGKTDGFTREVTNLLMDELSKTFHIYQIKDYRSFKRVFDYVDGNQVSDEQIDLNRILVSSGPNALLLCEVGENVSSAVPAYQIRVTLVFDSGEQSLIATEEWYSP